MTLKSKIMKLGSIALIVLSFNSLSFGQNKNFIDQPFLETSAKVDTLVIPDRIYLDIQLKESDSKNKISVEELENKMVDGLKNLGIDIDKQLSIKDATTDFRKYFLKGQGIEKTKEYQLIVYDGLMLGKVIQTLEKQGVSNVDLVKVAYSKIEELQIQLKSKAILKAKQQATALAKPLGQDIGNAIHIMDRSHFYNSNNYRESADVGMAMMKTKEYSPKSLNIHKIQVFSEVSVKFKLE